MMKSCVDYLRKIIYAWDERRHARLIIPITKQQSLTPTVYFLTPDHNTPSGGIRVIYRHVDLLNSAGIRAFILHQHRGFRCTWFKHNTQVIDVSAARIGRGDLLVVSEPDVNLICKLPIGVKHVIFNQNTHLTWRWASDLVTSHYNTSPDLAEVIVVSDHNKEMLRYAFGEIPVRRIHLSIDPTLFYPSDNIRGPRIAYMSRKGKEDAKNVLHLLHSRGVLDGWEVVPLDGLTHAEVAEQLRTTKIFLAFTYQEGFGLPPAEAMACGNYVIGYHGCGGREFFLPEFSSPIETGDILSFARAVEDAVIYDRTNPLWCFDRGQRASAFILAKYSLEQERNEVVNIYTNLMGCSATSLVRTEGVGCV
jgi:glycosyltransferase involved in cell wall biosynthesis